MDVAEITKEKSGSDVAEPSDSTRPTVDPRIRRFPERLRAVIGATSLRGFARRAGLSEGVLRSYLRGETLPTLDRLITIAATAGATPEWLISGQGYVSPGDAASPGLDAPGLPLKPEDYIYVPLYEVSAAAGHGAEVAGERIVDFLAFRTWFVKHDLRADPKDLAIVWVFGDSMEPTLSDGDVVMIDRSKTRLDAEAMYVLRTDSMLLVKRVHATRGALFQARSDNAGYPPMEFTMGDIGRDIHVIGRVVWAGKRM